MTLSDVTDTWIQLKIFSQCFFRQLSIGNIKIVKFNAKKKCKVDIIFFFFTFLKKEKETEEEKENKYYKSNQLIV